MEVLRERMFELVDEVKWFAVGIGVHIVIGLGVWIVFG